MTAAHRSSKHKSGANASMSNWASGVERGGFIILYGNRSCSNSDMEEYSMYSTYVRADILYRWCVRVTYLQWCVITLPSSLFTIFIYTIIPADCLNISFLNNLNRSIRFYDTWLQLYLWRLSFSVLTYDIAFYMFTPYRIPVPLLDDRTQRTISSYLGIREKFTFLCEFECDSNQTLRSIWTKFCTHVFWTQNLNGVR